MLSTTEIDALIADKEFKGFKRILLTRKENITSEQLEILSHDEDETVRKGAALNPKLGDESRRRIIAEAENWREYWARKASKLLPEYAD